MAVPQRQKSTYLSISAYRIEAGGVAVLSICEVQGSISSTKPSKTNKTPTKIQEIPGSPESCLVLDGDFFFFFPQMGSGYVA